MDRSLVRELAAECLGTFLLIAFGAASVAQMVLSQHTLGSTLSVNISWGLGVMLGAYASAGRVRRAISIRPCRWPSPSSATSRCARSCPTRWRRRLGAFLASAVVFLTYREALDAFDHGVRAVSGPTGTAGIWATYPATVPVDRRRLRRSGRRHRAAADRALRPGRREERQAAALPRSRPRPACWSLAIGATFGMNSGYAINPARDLGPRLFTAVAGWGGDVFRAGNGWWWVPLVAPPIGALLGAFVYDAAITRLRPAEPA